MKNIFTLIVLSLSLSVMAQDFDKNVATAKSAYSSGDLENTRFALEQALHELDIVIGKEILKQLPTKLGAVSYNEKEDNVTGGSGIGTGLFVHRSFGQYPNSGKIDVINNSPLITSINAILAIPFIGNSGDGTQKVVKIQGYKAVLNRNANEETGKTGYTLQVPMNNTLFTLEMDDTNENEIQSLANAIPLNKIAQMAQ
ncbi:MAG TPA: hypothetical protein DIS90_06350 [Cytophagales bacterium]|nr:hypothetical protein [Cytophagales bacterium]HCR53556.1 hypothetical protein [Cytophagales bacterium]